MENINIAEPIHTANVVSKSVVTDLIFSFFQILYKAILGVIDIISSLVDLLSWPVIVFAAILIFRKSLIDLINRISKLGKGGAEFYNPQSSQSEEKESSADKLGIISENFHPLVERWIPKVDRLLEQKAKDLAQSKNSILIPGLSQITHK
ncbi:MAG: hypothetical protein KAS59_04200, partial [Alphaproteobacteria bacterium]|nr:hypothetical protein [Alphaproteobacteria bacterium]